MIFRWILLILPGLELAGQTHEAVSAGTLPSRNSSAPITFISAQSASMG
jgi:hypothetical protein